MVRIYSRTGYVIMPLGIEKAALMGGGGGGGVDFTPTKNHAVGGYTGSGYNFLNQVYTPDSNSWATGAAYAESGWQGIFQFPQCWDGVNMISYQIGARHRESNNNTATGTSKKYTSASDAWAGITGITNKRQAPTTAFIDEYHYTISGENVSAVTTDVNRYDPSGDSYSAMTSCTTGRQFAQGMGNQVGSGGDAYLMTGQISGGGVTASNEKYTASTNAWASIAASTSYERQYAGQTGSGDFIHVISGHDGSTAFQTAHRRYTPGSDAWASKTGYGTGVQNFWCYGTLKSGTAYVYISGGSLSGTDNSTTSSEYSNISDSWSNKTALPTGARWDP